MIEYWLPSLPLRGYVRQLQFIHFDFSKTANPPVKWYWPRPENCLTFYPRDLETITYADQNGSFQSKPRSVLVGQPTMFTNRHMGHDFMIFQVVFQPGALFRLTGLPAYALTDTFIDAEAVFSSEIRLVNELVSSVNTRQEMADIIERFLYGVIGRSKKVLLPIDRVSDLMLNYLQRPSLQTRSVDWLAKEACLSPKQFYRKSMERLGISPKLFDRIIRFNQAAKLRDTYPAKDWLSIAIESGYHDYQHMVRDFKTFTTLTPTEFVLQETQGINCL